MTKLMSPVHVFRTCVGPVTSRENVYHAGASYSLKVHTSRMKNIQRLAHSSTFQGLRQFEGVC